MKCWPIAGFCLKLDVWSEDGVRGRYRKSYSGSMTVQFAKAKELLRARREARAFKDRSDGGGRRTLRFLGNGRCWVHGED